METNLTFYRHCIKHILNRYASLTTENPDIELIFDDQRMRYLAIWVGWENMRRIHQCAIHIDIKNNKIMIQLNDTEELIENTLIDMGIPKTEIHLSMIPA